MAHKPKINRKETKHQLPKENTKEAKKTSLDEEEEEEEEEEEKHRSKNSLVVHRDSGHHVEGEQC